jgi:serine/threonine protein kinase/tetratricopeptide (TPR) repeat protein
VESLKHLGRYEIVEPIGGGGMGLVFLGRDPRLNRPVALKVIRSSFESIDPEKRARAVERFYVEAQAAGKLSHPAIVTIYDFGEEKRDDGPLVYLAMEFLDGVGLDVYIRDKTLPDLAARLGVIRKIAEGLAYAHRQGVIHRDVKPPNIVMVGVHQPKLTDFGLARMSTSSLTVSGVALGTPSYMAPEQIQGGKVDARADVYGLSVVAYELLTGRRPFEGNNLTAVIYKVVNEQAPPPTTVDPTLPAVIDGWLAAGLAKEPDDRYPNMDRFIDALDRVSAKVVGGADASTLAIPEEVSRRLPVKQRLYLTYKPKLAPLARRFPHIVYSIDDKPLARNLADILEKTGFIPHVGPVSQGSDLPRYIATSLAQGRLMLLHYRSPIPGYNLIDLLREVRRSNPTLSFAHLAPIFMGQVTSQKQQIIFRLLASFGVRFAVFVTPSGLVESALEETLDKLVELGELFDRGFANREATPLAENPEAEARVERYKELVAAGDAAMAEGETAKAIERYTQAIELNADFATLIHRGDAYYKIRKYVPALNDYREAHRLEQTSPDPYAKIAGCCLIMARQAAAEGDVERAKGWFDVGMKRLDEAEKIIARMVDESREFPEKLLRAPFATPLSALAEFDLTDPAYDEQRRRFTPVVHRILDATADMRLDDPVIDVEVFIDRSVTLALNGRFDEARRIFMAILARDPESVGPAFNNLAIRLRRRGEHGQGFEIYTQLLRYPIPDRDIVTENMRRTGVAYAAGLREAGRFDEAAGVLRETLNHAIKEKEWTLCEFAETLLAADHADEARIRFMEALFMNQNLMKDDRFARYPRLAPLYEEMMTQLTRARR